MEEDKLDGLVNAFNNGLVVQALLFFVVMQSVAENAKDKAAPMAAFVRTKKTLGVLSEKVDEAMREISDDPTPDRPDEASE